MKRLYTFFAAMLSCASIFSQEALKSTEEEYYDFLSLQGLVERPTLGYRTLSDSEWTLTEEAKTADENVWKNNSLGSKWTAYEPAQKTDNFFTRGIDQSVKVKIYGPEWFNSYNTAAPYGQNDGALWQGKGYNTSFTAGARLEAYGLEATFKPQLSFSQNREFDYIKPNYPSVDENNNFTIYNGKADTYGYYGVQYIDAPQRFGDKAFFTYDWGDTEIRYTWHNLTAGIGTQTIWLGPAKINPILHSNNAPSYPKIDFGLRKTKIGYLGEIEGRIWYGRLSESQYFDNDSTNDTNLITGMTANWKPFNFANLYFGGNIVSVEKWTGSLKQAITSLNPKNYGSASSRNSWDADKRLSFSIDYIIDKAGFEAYLEWGKNDHPRSIRDFFHYPYHTAAYTAGIVKTINFRKDFVGKILFEISNFESSNNYGRILPWTTSFFVHDQITQGYTNNGQWLGAGIGTGGRSQYLSFTLYYPKGNSSIFFQRQNPDLDYTWFVSDNSRMLSLLSFGITTQYYFNTNMNVFLELTGMCQTSEFIEHFQNEDKFKQEYIFNQNIKLGLKYNL